MSNYSTCIHAVQQLVKNFFWAAYIARLSSSVPFYSVIISSHMNSFPLFLIMFSSDTAALHRSTICQLQATSRRPGNTFCVKLLFEVFTSNYHGLLREKRKFWGHANTLHDHPHALSDLLTASQGKGIFLVRDLATFTEKFLRPLTAGAGASRAAATACAGASNVGRSRTAYVIQRYREEFKTRLRRGARALVDWLRLQV